MNTQNIIEHIKSAIDQANLWQSKLDARILQYDGMSYYKIRHLFNIALLQK